jgi:hypothetical protein
MLDRAKRHGRLGTNPMQGVEKFKEPEGRTLYSTPGDPAEAAIAKALTLPPPSARGDRGARSRFVARTEPIRLARAEATITRLLEEAKRQRGRPRERGGWRAAVHEMFDQGLQTLPEVWERIRERADSDDEIFHEVISGA